MFIGLLMLVASWGVTLNGWVVCYAWSLLVYGVGVGGEYPMTATSGMENAVGSGKVSTKEDRLHRGRKVTSAFLMQGWGQFFNQVSSFDDSSTRLFSFNQFVNPGHSHPTAPHLPPRLRKPSIFRTCRSMDLSHLVCNSSSGDTMASVLPYL